MRRTVLLIVPFAVALAGAVSTARAASVTYEIDPAHTYPSFEADHMGLSVWRGKMTKSSGTVRLDKTAQTGEVDVAVDLSSIDFGMPQLNGWARGKEFFDVDRFPTATYRGRLDGYVDGRPTRVTGDMTLHGVTRPMILTLNQFKCVPHPLLKRELCGADALATFDRSAFGLDAGKDYGFKMEVTLRIQVEAIAAP
jgi:polyisoprenoid-binding protein YceI